MKRGKHLIVSLGAILILAGRSGGQDSLNITHLGQLNYWGNAEDVALSGAYACVLESQYGLHVVDVSDPAGMEEVGQCPFNSSSFCVATSGGYAYVGVFDGLYIVDLTNPAAPEILGFCPTHNWVRSIEAVYPFAYAAASGQGLLIINVADPTSPVVVGRFDSPGVALEVVLAGTLAYLADGVLGFWIIDVSNPATPHPLGHRDTPYYAHDLTVADPFVYVLDGEGYGGWGAGLMIYDASDPTQPVLLSTCGPFVEATDVKVSGDYAFVAVPGRGFRMINVSNPIAPHEVSIFLDDGYTAEIELSGTMAYTAGWGGLTILSLTHPLTPVRIGNYHPVPGAREVEVVGDYAYVCKMEYGLEILDVSDPAQPRWKGFCSSPGSANDVAIGWPYAYLADGGTGLLIIDVSNPENPAEVGSIDPGGDARGVALNYPYVYLACYGEALCTIDVSDPTTPVQVSSWSHCYVSRVTVAGMYAYVGTASTNPPGMRIFSLTNPASPCEISEVNFTGQIFEIALTGSTACVATEYGLRLVDVANPSSPILLYSSNTWGSWDIDVDGSLVYLTAQVPYLRVLSIVHPTAPVEVGHYQLFTYSGLGIDVVDSIAYLGREHLFDVYDCSDCAISSPATSTSVNSHADRKDERFPSAFLLHPCSPNPFNPSTVLSFELRVSSIVQLEVFDINGARVGTGLAPVQGGGRTPALQERWYPAGSHQIPFDGSDLPSGIYFAKLTVAPSGSVTTPTAAVQKLVLLK